MNLFMRAIRPGGILVSYGHPERGCRFSPYVFQMRDLRMQGPVNNMEIIRSRGKEIMEMVAPVGPVYQAGTLSGNPVAMAAGLAQLSYLKEHPEFYQALEEKDTYLYGSMERLIKKAL